VIHLFFHLLQSNGLSGTLFCAQTAGNALKGFKLVFMTHHGIQGACCHTDKAPNTFVLIHVHYTILGIPADGQNRASLDAFPTLSADGDIDFPLSVSFHLQPGLTNICGFEIGMCTGFLAAVALNTDFFILYKSLHSITASFTSYSTEIR